MRLSSRAPANAGNLDALASMICVLPLQAASYWSRCFICSNLSL